MDQSIKIGDMAPEFEIETTDNGIKRLSDYSGKFLVLYFYPKDNTSGCTKQAIEFTEKKSDFLNLNAEILGVSRNSIKQHLNFIEKQNLAITLGSDPDHKIIEMYGSWVEKSMYGRKYMGIDRSTFLITPEGKLAGIWRKVRILGHIDEVLKHINTL